jgi:protein TonB
LLLWLLRFLPATAPIADAPVAIRMLATPPTALQPLPAAPPPPALKPQPPKKDPAQQRPAKGGILAELPKPQQIERPDDARLVAKYDSKAQDIGEGKTSARRPSGAMPQLLPPELALPERYSQTRPQTPKQTTMTPLPTAPLPAAEQPAPQQQARQMPRASTPPREPSGAMPQLVPPELALPERNRQTRPRTPAPRPTVDQPAPQRQARQVPRDYNKPQTTRQPDLSISDGTLPVPKRETPPPPLAPTPELRKFHITDQQELAMVQRNQPDHQAAQPSAKQSPLSEHFARLEKHQPLPIPTFDAPGAYQPGPERPGEGHDTEGGGKYRSIDAYGLKHFSYLVGVKRKIELLFSVPFFMQNHGTVGVPIVGFTIRRNGLLADAVLLRSSGYAVLDKALLDAVRRAAPYSPFPNHLADPEISIRVYATVS